MLLLEVLDAFPELSHSRLEKDIPPLDPGDESTMRACLDAQASARQGQLLTQKYNPARIVEAGRHLVLRYVFMERSMSVTKIRHLNRRINVILHALHQQHLQRS